VTGLSSRTETSGTSAVCSLISDAVDDAYPSYPQSRPSDSAYTRGQVSVSRQPETVATSSASVSPGLLRPAPSPSSLTPSPKRRRLEAAMETYCDLQASGDQQSKAVLPVICLNEETDSPSMTRVNSTAVSEGGTELCERSDKLSPSPSVADLHERRDTNCCPKNDEKTLSIDRKSPSDDS